MLDHRGRVARVEAREGPAVDLPGQEQGRIRGLHRQGLRVIGEQNDLARARSDRKRRARERAEHVDDDRRPGGGTRALDEAGPPNLH